MEKQCMSKVIEIEDMTLVLGGRKILNIPYFCVEAEEAISFMGPNGAGKSSLMLIMATLLEPTTGTVHLFGKKIKEQTLLDLRRRMAMVFQKPMMLDLTVLENVEVGLKFRNMKRKERKRQVEPWLEKLSIAHLARQRARSLSGGEAQRVAIAQALVLQPEIIFFDEPFSNLDKDTRQELMEDLTGLLRQQKITTVMVSHHKREALTLTDTIYYMEDGEIVNQEKVAQRRVPDR
jgi:tungstate transport system ATP-binding protein